MIAIEGVVVELTIRYEVTTANSDASKGRRITRRQDLRTLEEGLAIAHGDENTEMRAENQIYHESVMPLRNGSSKTFPKHDSTTGTLDASGEYGFGGGSLQGDAGRFCQSRGDGVRRPSSRRPSDDQNQVMKQARGAYRLGEKVRGVLRGAVTQMGLRTAMGY